MIPGSTNWRRMVATVAAVAALLPGAVGAQLEQSKRSVVKLICELPRSAAMPNGGVMNSTGFVWGDKLHVVTALHAVAGCTNITVKNEATGAPALVTKIEKALLEADLALVLLNRDLGVPPLRHAAGMPDFDAVYRTAGYPHGIETMSTPKTEFDPGLTGGLTTLAAYGSAGGIDQLFSQQAYPKPSASILRVFTTLQPGLSGAPILDRDGVVVAIADGGLLGGVVGINWSMPAYVYLPRLRGSSDKAPSQPSAWAGLYSAVTVTATKTVEVPRAAQLAGQSAAGELRRVRRLSLTVLKNLKQGKGEELENYDFIRGMFETQADFDQLAFDIYEDPATGATLGVPAGLTLAWNPEIRALEARSGASRMIVGVLPARSFDDALANARNAFLGKVMGLANWSNSPADMGFEHFDKEMQWANNAKFFSGTDRASNKPFDLMLSLTVSGSQLLGFAVYGPEKIENLPKAELVANLMMYMAGNDLSNFAVH